MRRLNDTDNCGRTSPHRTGGSARRCDRPARGRRIQQPPPRFGAAVFCFCRVYFSVSEISPIASAMSRFTPSTFTVSSPNTPSSFSSVLSATICASLILSSQQVKLGTLWRLPGITWRKVGMTSNHHAPYDLGYTRATMA